MQKAYEALSKARQKIRSSMMLLCAQPHSTAALEELEKQGKVADKHLKSMLTLKEEGQSLERQGSGKILLMQFDLDP